MNLSIEWANQNQQKNKTIKKNREKNGENFRKNFATFSIFFIFLLKQFSEILVYPPDNEHGADENVSIVDDVISRFDGHTHLFHFGIVPSNEISDNDTYVIYF